MRRRRTSKVGQGWRRIFAGGAIAAALAAAGPAAFGQGVPVWIPNGVPVSVATGNQQGPVCLSDGAGGALLAWVDYRNGAAADIYAQRIGPNGGPLWTAGGIPVCAATNIQQNPAIALDASGGMIVAWQDGRNGVNDDIYAQRINPEGVVLWAVDGVAVCTATNHQQSPAMAMDGSGGVMIAWHDFRTSTTYSDLYAQRLNGAGIEQWLAAGISVCTAPFEQLGVTATEDGAGGALFAWHDQRNGSGNYDIYAQRLDGSGAALWLSNGVGVCNWGSNQRFAAMIGDGASGTVIAWQDDRSGPNIYAQRVTAAGALAWATAGVMVCSAVNNQEWPRLVTDGAGGALITWHDFRPSTSNADIYASRVTTAGALPWTANGRAVCTASSNQMFPAIIPDGAGGAILCWQDARGSSNDIFAQRVDSSGASLWTTNGIAVCSLVGNQTTPVICGDSYGGALVLWPDERTGTNRDLYAQRIYNGNQPCPALLASPANVSMVGTLTPTFNWTAPVADGSTYTLEVALSARFSPVDRTVPGIAGTTYTLTAPQALTQGSWYWRVRATNVQGSIDSVVWEMMVDTQAPPAPVLVAPPNGASTGETPSFDWDDVVDPE